LPGLLETDEERDEVEEDVVLAGDLAGVKQFQQEVLKAVRLALVDQPVTGPGVPD